MDLKKKWQSYLSNLQPGDDIEIEHLEFLSSPNNTADRILCLYKESSDKYILSVQVPSILASANDYPNPEDYEDGINGEYVRMQLGEYLIGYDKENFGGDDNICVFSDISDPKIREYLNRNGWGESGTTLYSINLPDKYGYAWNL